MDQDQIQLILNAKSRLDNWEVTNMSRADQIEWFQKNVVSLIANNVKISPVVEVTVAEPLFDAAISAIENPELPEDLDLGENLPEGIDINDPEIRERLRVDFQAYCKTITVKSAIIDQLALPDQERYPLQMQFVRMLTAAMKSEAWVEQWDQSLGFSRSMQEMGCPLTFSVGEKKLFFGVATTLQLLFKAQAQQMAAMQNQNSAGVNMFDPGR